jgi:hypothetical protein
MRSSGVRPGDEGSPAGWATASASGSLPPASAGLRTAKAAQPWKSWPVPVGRVVRRDGLTFVHATEPDGFDVEEFRRIPDGRAELLDGVVVLRPEPTAATLRMLARIYEDLANGGCPDGFTAVHGPVDVRVGPATVLRPDVAVMPADGGEDALPVLVVEARPDYHTHHRWEERRAKVHGYRDAGVASYWTLNPETGKIRVYELGYMQRPKQVVHDKAVGTGRRWGWRLWAEPGARLEDGRCTELR